MWNEYLDFNAVNSLARQAVDLLVPAADLTIEESPRNNAYVYPQATGADHGIWRITVTIAPGNAAVLTLDPRWSPGIALSNLITELSHACGGEFRGRPFPSCPDHDHPADVEIEGDTVVLRCPDNAHDQVRLFPAIPDTGRSNPA